MERRSAEIAERRLAREQRREAKMRERAEQLAKEEEEQRKAEAALKEAKLKQKREERQLAKQVQCATMIHLVEKSVLCSKGVKVCNLWTERRDLVSVIVILNAAVFCLKPCHFTIAARTRTSISIANCQYEGAQSTCM